MSSSEREKIELIVKVLIYYKEIIKELLEKNVSSIIAMEWLRKSRFYSNGSSETDCKVSVKVLILYLLRKSNKI